MRAIKTCAVAVVLAAGSAGIASAQSVQNDPLPYFKVLSIYKEVCAKEAGAIIKPEDDKALAASAEDIMKFEVARSRAIRPTLPDPEARKLLNAHADNASKAVKARFTGKCDAAENTRFVTSLKTQLADPAKLAEIKKNIETGVPYDKPRKVSDAAGAPVTFTTAQFGKQLLDGQLKGGKACARQEVTGIELVSRKAKPVQGQPPHIRVQQEYVEDWTVACDGEAKKYRITFTQDDRSARGKHEVAEAKK